MQPIQPVLGKFFLTEYVHLCLAIINRISKNMGLFTYLYSVTRESRIIWL